MSKTPTLAAALRRRGMSCEMVYTGQTGWLQGSKFGFVLDSTANDFVSGELEHAIVSCDKELKPSLILLEGQSALRRPFENDPPGGGPAKSARTDPATSPAAAPRLRLSSEPMSHPPTQEETQRSQLVSHAAGAEGWCGCTAWNAPEHTQCAAYWIRKAHSAGLGNRTWLSVDPGTFTVREVANALLEAGLTWAVYVQGHNRFVAHELEDFHTHSHTPPRVGP